MVLAKVMVEEVAIENHFYQIDEVRDEGRGVVCRCSLATREERPVE